MPDPRVLQEREPDWHGTAVHMWANGSTPREIAEAVDHPLPEVQEYLAQATYAAVDLALKGGGWK